jgi:hypothetical protein
LYTHLGNLPTHLRKREKEEQGGRRRVLVDGGTGLGSTRLCDQTRSVQFRSEVAGQGLLLSGCEESNCEDACSETLGRRIS